jgi:hypothetical protein
MLLLHVEGTTVEGGGRGSQRRVSGKGSIVTFLPFSLTNYLKH